MLEVHITFREAKQYVNNANEFCIFLTYHREYREDPQCLHDVGRFRATAEGPLSLKRQSGNVAMKVEWSGGPNKIVPHGNVTFHLRYKFTRRESSE